MGGFSTLGARVLAWLNVQRHEELLSQTFLVAAQDPGLIASQAEYVNGGDAFSEFVADAEADISRDRTLWLARRDTLAGAEALSALGLGSRIRVGSGGGRGADGSYFDDERYGGTILIDFGLILDGR